MKGNGNVDQPPPIWSTGRARQQHELLQQQHELQQLPARQTVTTHARLHRTSGRSGQAQVANNAPQQSLHSNRPHRPHSFACPFEVTVRPDPPLYQNTSDLTPLILAPHRTVQQSQSIATPSIASDDLIEVLDSRIANACDRTLVQAQRINFHLDEHRPTTSIDSNLKSNGNSIDCSVQLESNCCDLPLNRPLVTSNGASVGRRRVKHTVRRIGVFYSDLCDVIRSMRPPPPSATSTTTQMLFETPKSAVNCSTDENSNVPTVTSHRPTCSTESSTLAPESSANASNISSGSQSNCVVDAPLFAFPSLIHSHPPLLTGGLLPVPIHNHLPDLLHSHLPSGAHTIAVPTSLAAHFIQTSGPVPQHIHPQMLNGANLMAQPSTAPAPICSSVTANAAILPLPHLPRLPHCTSPSLPKPCLHCAQLGARWFVLLVALIGLLCALLGAYLLCTNARPDQLPLALLMLGKSNSLSLNHLNRSLSSTVFLHYKGVGLLLIAISGLALRLSSSQLSSANTSTSGQSRCANEMERRFLPRPTTVRAQHPYGAMLYPEFEYRPPPPTYAASMQQQRLRLAAFRRGLSGRRSCTWSSLLNGLSGFSGLNGLSSFNASNRLSGLSAAVAEQLRVQHVSAASPPPTYQGSQCSSPADSLRRPPSYRTALRDHKQLPTLGRTSTSETVPIVRNAESSRQPREFEPSHIILPATSELQILAHL
jgi:hypothetical protein